MLIQIVQSHYTAIRAKTKTGNIAATRSIPELRIIARVVAPPILCYTHAGTRSAACVVGVAVNTSAARANSFAQSSQSVTNSIRLCPLLHHER